MVQVLLPRHREMLVSSSGIGDDIIASRGYFSATTKAELKQLGFPASQQLIPTLVLTIWSVKGEIGGYQHRPDTPRMPKGKPVKYETLARMGMILDVHPNVRPSIGNPASPLFITEGIKKADAAITHGLCCIALLGVWNWRGSNEQGGKTVLADWESIALNGRRVYIVFDSDVMGKKEVHAALARLKAFLESRGGEVWIIYLPTGEGGRKTGLDDYLIGHSTGDLLALATPDLRPMESDGEATGDSPFRATSQGMSLLKVTSTGVTAVPLTNFNAAITAQIEEDDGAEVVRVLQVAFDLNGRTGQFTLPAEMLFQVRRWAVIKIGAGAVVHPSQGSEAYAAAAIQVLSGDIPLAKVYKHTGWREVAPGTHAYLNAGSVIGDVELGGICVRLTPPLDNFCLPEPPSGEEAIRAVRASLEVLAVGPETLTVPLYAAVWRAAIATSDFGVFFVGQSGEFKSELAALGQQHYGPAMNARNFPAAWEATENYLEVIAFAAKDALLVIDDYAPRGGQQEQARLAAKADRVLRAQGNNSARGRLNADLTTRPLRRPRGLIVSTGEDIPPGHSLRARNLIVNVSRGDVIVTQLTRCQRDAEAGLYAQAMSAFLAWCAPQHEALQARRRERVKELRGQVLKNGGNHARTPEIVANLAVGVEIFLDFAEEVGAISASERRELWRRSWDAIRRVAVEQGQHQASSEPVERYLELLRSALSSGEAHVANTDGEEPASPQTWGWRRAEVGAGENFRVEWRPQGKRIGWLDGTDLYLEPQAAYQVAKRLGDLSGEGIAIGQRTLHRHLKDKELLLKFEEERGAVTRQAVEGKRVYVLHLSSGTLTGQETARTAQADTNVADRDDAPAEAPSDEKPYRQETPPISSVSDGPGVPSQTTIVPDNVSPGQFGQFGQFPSRDRSAPDLTDWNAVDRKEFEL